MAKETAEEAQERKQQANLDWVNECTIFECVAGSHAYGNATELSDVDYRSIVIPPERFYQGIAEFEQKLDWPDGGDRVAYSVTKLLRTLASANPTMMELLWMPEDCIKFMTPAYRILRDHRDQFITLMCRDSYLGYAASQMGRINRHKAWMEKPLEKPKREDFGLFDDMVMSTELLIKLSELFDRSIVDYEHGMVDITKVDTPLLRRFNNEYKFEKAKKQYKLYRGWVKNRNPARATLEAKFGYDTKHASHLVRLLAQSELIALTGKLEVRLNNEDLQLIKAVRAGDYKYDELLFLAAEMERDVKQIFEENPCNLPARCDMLSVEWLNGSIIKMANDPSFMKGNGTLSY